MTPKSFALLAAAIMCACAWCACITNESEAAVQHGSSSSPLWSLSLSAYDLQTDSNKTYHLRFRQVLDDPNRYWSFDYIELCPKSVYGSPEGEDTH